MSHMFHIKSFIKVSNSNPKANPCLGNKNNFTPQSQKRERETNEALSVLFVLVLYFRFLMFLSLKYTKTHIHRHTRTYTHGHTQPCIENILYPTAFCITRCFHFSAGCSQFVPDVSPQLLPKQPVLSSTAPLAPPVTTLKFNKSEPASHTN